jgi:hypothetical protein
MSIHSLAALTFMLAALALSLVLFRDLADISQWVLRTSRKKIMRTFYNRHPMILALGILWGGGLAAASVGGFDRITVIAIVGASVLILIFLFMGYVNPKLMMRSQQSGARYFDISQATPHIDDETSLIVVETARGAFGHPDRHVLRPHVAGIPGDPDGTVLTYCGLTNMGIAYVPEIGGAPVELEAVTQLENNLVMWDKSTGEPVQQFWGTRERDGKNGPRMPEVATYRMPFRAFRKRFPQGQVFLNLFPSFLRNPFLAVFDRITHWVFAHAVDEQASKEKPTFPTIERFDSRLPNKQKIFGANVGDTYFAVTKQHVRDHDDRLDLDIGGTIIHVVYHLDDESLGMYIGSRETVGVDIAFGGRVDGRILPRLSTMKSEAFWVVWQNFYPETVVNPVGKIELGTCEGKRGAA